MSSSAFTVFLLFFLASSCAAAAASVPFNFASRLAQSSEGASQLGGSYDGVQLPSPAFTSSSPLSLSTRQPSAVWSATLPKGALYHSRSGLLFIFGTAETDYAYTLFKVTSSGERLASLELNSSLAILSIAASDSSLFALALNLSNETAPYQLFEVDIASFTLLHSLRAPSWMQLLLAVDAAGQTIFAAKRWGSQVVRLDARTLQQQSVYTGSRKSLQVWGGGWTPSSVLIVLDVRAQAVIAINASDDSVLWSSPLPADLRQYSAFAVATDGSFAFLLYVRRNSSGGICNTFALYDLSSGRQTATSCVDPAVLINLDFTGAARAGDVTLIDYGDRSVCLLRNGSVLSRFQVTEHPLLPLPCDIAVTGTGDAQRIFVMTRDAGITELSPSGQLVAQLPIDTSGCPRRSIRGIQDIAVDGAGRLYVPHCNGSLLVYSAQYELLQVVSFGKDVLPTAVSPTAGAATVFIVDLNRPAALSEYDLKTGERLRTLQAGADAALRDVEVDVLNGSVWATDANASCVYHWAADGSLLSLFNRSSPSDALLHSPYYLAVDRANGQLLLSEQTINVSSLAVSASLLWLDAATGAELDRFTFPALAKDLAMGVAVTEDGATVYATTIPVPWNYGVIRPVYVFQASQQLTRRD